MPPRKPMNVVVWNNMTVPGDAPQFVHDADLVVHFSFGGGPALAEHETVVEVNVLRSRWGDPFRTAMVLDLSYRDPKSVAEREKRSAEEIAAALAVLKKHGIVAAPEPPGHPLGEPPKMTDGAAL